MMVSMDTQRVFAMYDGLSLPELADRLDELDDRRTPVGWSPEDAMHRSTLERRIVDRVARSRRDRGAALACSLDIQVRSKDRTARATLIEVAEGGVVVETDLGWVLDSVVDLVLAPSLEDHGVRVRGRIAAIAHGRLQIELEDPPSEAHERRLHRFLREAIRHRVHN